VLQWARSQDAHLSCLADEYLYGSDAYYSSG
jgi:hypothetical protein